MLLFLLCSFGNQVIAQVTDPELKQRFKTRSIEKENEGLAEPFKGITVDGNVSEGLFELKSTGVSTEPMRKAPSTSDIINIPPEAIFFSNKFIMKDELFSSAALL